ncbi:Alcohol dehydrogenase [Desulfosporosinus sp. I2]|nr:Alcohol dehydrogenase [Desulfosporosinus sp. I2]
MPREVTISSGIDVLTNAIEAYVSFKATPVTDALALVAIKLVFNYLRKAAANGNDTEAREKKMYAEFMAGMSFNNAGVGYIHAIAHQIGGFSNPNFLRDYELTFSHVRCREILKAFWNMEFITLQTMERYLAWVHMPIITSLVKQRRPWREKMTRLNV